MKQLLAMISKGRDVPEFLPDVVKNVVVRSIEVKKLVYIYLVHYADFDPNCRQISLLSINSFQKDLSDSNHFFRGLALRVMTSIRVPEIIHIQLHAVRKCASDTSVYVRKCSAHALVKVGQMTTQNFICMCTCMHKHIQIPYTIHRACIEHIDNHIFIFIYSFLCCIPRSSPTTTVK
ncbi:hypothetical protein EON65_46485 [archaeon]|nr:MAG: hypothetical protein EON65_46485 [archaeon]